MTSLFIPPEVIDSVFYFLQVDEGVDHYHQGVATLKSCANDPVLSRFAEHHYYSTITLRDLESFTYPGVFNPTHLLKLFSDHPHIALHVRIIRIILTVIPKPSLAHVLSKVSQLEYIGLTIDEDPYVDIVPWNSLPDSFCTAFLDCVKSPHMKRVVLGHQRELPLSVLDSCSVPNLFLFDVQISSDFDPQLTLDDTPSHRVPDDLTLNRLHVSDAQFEVWAKRRIRNLRSLRFSIWNTESFTTLSLLFSHCSNTLTSLHLSFGETCLTLYDFASGTITPPQESIQLSLSSLRCLQQLKIGAEVVMDHRRSFYLRLENYSALPSICQLLATSPPSLTRLTLHLGIHFKGACNTATLSTMDWQPLVQFLDSPSLSIQQTRLDIIVRDYWPADNANQSVRRDEIVPTLCNSADISRLVEKGLLIINPLEVLRGF